LDVVLSSLALVFLAPLLALVALAVMLDSPGPVIFRQERVGRFGARFRILKFRSMRLDAERHGLAVTVGHDPRITRSGRFLRATKLDELPQLVNVLRGEMSIVGPRPEVPRYVALYPDAVREIVLSVRPGLTDPAALAFRDEAQILGASADPETAYVNDVMPRKLAMYVDYIQRRTVWSDVRIIGDTIRMIAGQTPTR
jgi:lipopolysaccharide/colanic/teichoic acid biosynthesis glycosyltransferase